MSGIQELRQRVQDAEEHFGLARAEQAKYSDRLIGLIDAVEGRLREQQAEIDGLQATAAGHDEALAKEQAQIGRFEIENEQLREMLHSLLQAIESGGRNGIVEIMQTLDQKVSALIAGHAAPAEPEPAPEPEPEPEPKSEAAAEAVVESELETAPELVAEPDAEPVSEAAPEPEMEAPPPEPVEEPEAEPVAEAAPEPEMESAPPEPVEEPEAEPEMEAASPGPVEEPDAEPVAEAAPEPEMVSAPPEPVNEPEPEPEMEAAPPESVEEPEAEPVAEAAPEPAEEIAAEPAAEVAAADDDLTIAALEEIASELAASSTGRSGAESDSLHEIMDRVSRLVRDTENAEAGTPPAEAKPSSEKKSAAG